MHPFIQQSVIQLILALAALLFLAHVMLSILGFKKAVPKFTKWLFTGLGRGLVWFIQWFVGLLRDGIIAFFRGIFRGRPARRGGHGRHPPP